MTRSRPGDFRLYFRVFREARPFWPHLALTFVLDLVATPLQLFSPIPIKVAVDNILSDQPLPGWLTSVVPAGLRDTKPHLLLVVGGMTVLAVLLIQLRELAAGLLTIRTGEGLVRRFRARLFRHVQDLSLYYHDTRGTADSAFRIQYDAPALQWITVSGLLPFLTSVIMLVTTITVIIRINLLLALVAFAIAPILILIFAGFRAPIRDGYQQVKGLESSAHTVVQEALGSLRVVKAFGREAGELERYQAQSSAGYVARVKLALTEGLFGLLVNLAIAVGGALVLVAGVRSVLAGTLTLGALLVVMAYLAQLYRPLETLGKTAGTLQGSLASAERAFQLLDEVPTVQDRPHARRLTRARGELEFRGVSFGYGGDRPVLRDVSFHLPPGARVGVVGRTGAGKTTLVSLMTRFYDPDQGSVLLDGLDIRDLRLADVREQFAVVLQEPVLFSSSIAENIAYARPDASEEAILAAARAAGAQDFIAALPDGYATLVGERGMKLSGGERQRISLARAFLRDAPILILDEPTASVDIHTESEILEAMERLMAGRTTLMISHRPSTLRSCDRILRIGDGRVLAEPLLPPRRTGFVAGMQHNTTD